MITDVPAFIRANTRILSPPHTPEIRLHLADDAVALWELTEERLGELGLAPPFWAFAWAGGQALARFVLDHPDIVVGKSVLDLASGSGLVAIAAMKAGAGHATAADIDSFAAHAARLNAALNGVEFDPITEDVIGAPCAAQVILVGDLFYERDLAARLLAWLEERQRAGALVLIGDPERFYLPKDRLEKIASYEVKTSRSLEDAEVKRTSVWRLATPRSAPRLP